MDTAILALPAAHSGMEDRVLYHEPFLLAAHPAHSIAAIKTIQQKDLQGQPVLLLDEGHCIRDHALEICSQSGGLERTGIRSTSIETLRQLIFANMGITFFLKLAADTPSSRIHYMEFGKPAPSRTIGLIWRKTDHRKERIHKLGGMIAAIVNKSLAA